VAVGSRCPEPGRHPGRPQRKCPAASVGGPLLSSTDGWVAMRPDTDHAPLRRPWPAVALVPDPDWAARRTRCHVAVAAVDRRRVHTVGRRAEGDWILFGASDRRGHRHGHRHQPGQGCRTPAVRRAVVRAAIPEAADGQSADRSGSLQLPLLFLKVGPPARQPHRGHPGTGLTLPTGKPEQSRPRRLGHALDASRPATILVRRPLWAP
jgi:hypothetical protein